MSVYLSPLTAILQLFSNSGYVLSGGTITTYEAGTTTPTPTWTDFTGGTENANPITLNGYGRLQNVEIWQAAGTPIKALIQDDDGNTIATLDQIPGINDPTAIWTALETATSGSGADLIANAVRSYDIFATARAANVPSLGTHQTLIVIFEGGVSVSDGLGGAFYWNASSTATDDGLNTIAPTGLTAGRYLRITPVSATYASKSASTSQASTTTPVADPNLQLPIAGPGTYAIELWLNDAGGTSSGGLQGTVAFSGTSTDGYWSANAVGGDVTTVKLTSIGTAAELQSAQAGTASISIVGVLQATSSGLLSFKWAQQSSNATASLVGAGSWMRLTFLSSATGSFTPITHSYTTAGSFTETIPTGASNLTIEAFGGSGGGFVVIQTEAGAGGGSGARVVSTFNVASYNGQTINLTVGAAGSEGTNEPPPTSTSGGASTVSSGTFSLTTMSAGGGGSGFSGGAAGTASGGNSVNTNGNASSGDTGGAGISGTYGNGAAGGNGGSGLTGGGAGAVYFHYS